MTTYSPNYGWSDWPARPHGSSYFGGVLCIFSQYNEYVQVGRWLCTFWWKGKGHSYIAVMDDFGDLVPVKEF